MQSERELLAGQPLTRRELAALRLRAEGNTNHQTGRAMFVSEDTVKTHMRHVLAKLEANDTPHAVAIAMRTGLFTDPEDVAAIRCGSCGHLGMYRLDAPAPVRLRSGEAAS